jgi:hypothetical protein
MKQVMVSGKWPRVSGARASALAPISNGKMAWNRRSLVRSEFQPTNNWLAR